MRYIAMVNRAADRDGETSARLAVIEEKLETVLAELAAIRAYIPGKMVEYSERIAVLERNMRTVHWLGGILAVAIIGAFLEHVLGR
ncbi:MAG: hypothetical protein NTU88_00580 [Armatimonadetes bacterium]|nr:hypothetical protein [Armatimonadota bacterium]